MKIIAAFIRWWNGEADVFKAPSTAPNGVPRDRFAKVREHFDADGNYIIKDTGLARAAQTAKALGATMTATTLFVAWSDYNGANAYLVSADGVNWQQVGAPAGLASPYTCRGPDRWVSVDPGTGTSNVGAYSLDGLTWTATTLPATLAWCGVAYGDGKYVALSSNSTTGAYSTDGINWTAMTIPDAGVSQYWTPFIWTGSQFYAVCNQTGDTITSPDGITWTTGPVGGAYNCIIYAGGQYVGTGTGKGTSIYTSPDGVTWTTRTLPYSFYWQDIAYGNGTYICVGTGTSGATESVGAYSLDGVTWTSMTLPSSQAWGHVAYTDGRFVALSTANTTAAAYSSDGINWTAATLPSTTAVYGPVTVLPVSAPSAPTLTAPANTATINALNSTTFSATYNSTDGQNQNAFAMRFSANSGAYTYWDVATQAMSASIVWNPSNVAPGNSFSVVLPANALTNGDSYTWSMASQESGANLQGPFASDFALTTQAPPPSAPTLTAPANASTVDVATGVTFSATYIPNDGGTQTGYAFRVKTSSGSYNYWNVGTSALQSTIVWNPISTAPDASWSLALPAGVLTDGNVYNWSFASEEAGGGQQGPFASDFTLTAQAAPTVSVIAPSGTITDAYPAVSWTEAFPSGASQIAYQVIIESGTFGLTPGAGTSVWNSSVVSSTASSVGEPVGLQNGVTYRVFVQVTETNNVASAWAYSTFTASFVPPATPTFTVVAGNDPVTGAPMATLTIQANDNELTAAQASFETGTTGWAAGANTLLAASNAWAQDGAYSLAMTADAAGNVSASTPTGPSGVVCVPGQTVRAMASFHSPVTARAATVAVTFYDSTGAVISTDTSASVNSTLTGNGAQAFLTTTAPVNAATMSLTITGSSLAAPNATLTTALVSGTAYTTLAVTALTTAIAANAPVAVATAGAYQVFTASASAAVGATSIAVTSLAANAAYPVGSAVDGEALYVDEAFVGPGSSSAWSPGGFVGSSSANFTFSDDGVNWFAVRNGTGVAIPATQNVSTIDYEGALGFTRHYQAQVVAP